MFKKAINIVDDVKQTPKERKVLKADLQKNFDLDSVNHVCFNVDVFHRLKVEKSKMIIYSDGTDPLFVDSTSKKDYFPTVYALSMFPKLLKVSLILKEGADGTLIKTGQLKYNAIDNLDEVEEFSADDVVSIKKANGEIFGIGALAIGSADLKKIENKEELVAYILHYVGDNMYNIGSTNLKKIIYNGPEKEKSEKSEEQDDGSEDEDMTAFAGVNKNKKSTGDAKNKKINSFGKKVAKLDKPQPSKSDQKAMKTEKVESKPKDDEFDDDKKGGKKHKKKGKPKAHKEDEKEHDEVESHKDKKQSSSKEMDKNIKEAFLNCLILTVDDKNLPLENMVMWKEHIVPCKNPEVELDVKKSSYKTLGKFFQTMDKEEFIVYKEANKKSSTPQITEILRTNEILSEWEPTVSESANKKLKDDDGKKESSKIEITKSVKNMCKPKDFLKKYMINPPEDYIEYKDFVKKVEEYLKKQNLIKKKEVTINEDLKTDFGFDDEQSEDEEDENDEKDDKNKKKNGPKMQIDFDKLIDLMEKHITYVHKITDKKTGIEMVKDGKFPGIGVLAEKAHGKFVTRVTHLGELGVDLDKLLVEWEKRFGTSGSVHETTEGKNKIKEIILQGTWFDQVKDYLTIELKVSEEMLLTVNKLEKKKKKNN